LAVRQLVEAVLLEEERRREGGILRRRHQVRVRKEVHLQLLRELGVVVVAGRLDEPPPAVLPAVAAGLVSISYSVPVGAVGNGLRFVGVLLRLLRREPLAERL